jgi:hypothetical protein
MDNHAATQQSVREVAMFSLIALSFEDRKLRTQRVEDAVAKTGTSRSVANETISSRAITAAA